MRRTQAIPLTTYRRRQRIRHVVRQLGWLAVAIVAVGGLAAVRLLPWWLP